MVGIVHKSRHTDMKRYERVEVNVMLSYILQVLEKELKVKTNNKFQRSDYNDEITTYNKNVMHAGSLILIRLDVFLLVNIVIYSS